MNDPLDIAKSVMRGEVNAGSIARAILAFNQEVIGALDKANSQLEMVVGSERMAWQLLSRIAEKLGIDTNKPGPGDASDIFPLLGGLLADKAALDLLSTIHQFHVDHGDEEEDVCVFRIVGNVNDRQWETIGSGQTFRLALKNAVETTKGGNT
jgi:hypothetical protein